jgi:hypothetical protein
VPGPGAGGAGRRERVFRRDAFRCVYCGETFPEEQLTLDHVEPRMRGGDHSEGNLVTACRTCNTAKGSMPAWAYLAERAVERENFLRFGIAVWPRLRRAVEEAARRADARGV